MLAASRQLIGVELRRTKGEGGEEEEQLALEN